MEGGAYMCLVFCGLVCTAQGVTLTITTKFMGGDVLFLWTGTSPEYDVMITRDNKVDSWVRVTDTQYTVKDALLYDSIGINVRSPGDPTDNKMDYTVTKVDSNVGESVNISCTAPFFPQAGRYNIYHTDKVNRIIIQVTSGGVNLDQTKYEYHSRPYDSTNIMFEIRDITLDDAGYYNGGINEEAAWNGGGVVLIVHDKILKPQIQGNLDIMVSTFSELTCSTKSNSAPDYYARLFPLTSYTWFVNNTERTGETRETLRFLVTREHKYNQYSCSARDKQQISDRSDSVQINPLYKPDKVTITPQPSLNANDKLAVKEGGTVGPYYCSADCNPLCDIMWKYKDSEGGFYDAVSENGILFAQKVNRSIADIRCLARYQPNIKELENIKLDVQYLDFSILNTYETIDETLITTNVKEGTSLSISCYVDGNPTPRVRISKIHNNRDTVLSETTAHWSNYSFGRGTMCSDTGVYICSATIEGLEQKRKEQALNILCDPRCERVEQLEIYNGAKIGFKETVIVKIPITSNPPPLTSNITFINPDGQKTDSRSIVLQPRSFDIFKHLIVSIVQVSDSEKYGDYQVLYNDYPLINVTVNKEDLTTIELTGLNNEIDRVHETGFLITTSISAILGIILVSVILLFFCSKKKQAEHTNEGHYIEVNVCEPLESERDYDNLGTTDQIHCYSTLGDAVQEQSL